MLRNVLYLLAALLLCSCSKKMIQLSLLKPSSQGIVEKKDAYVFENDTVRITYSFWAHHGQFGFSIENKLNTPIYVDWKKSNLVYNNAPNVYWLDETVISTKSVSTGVGFRVSSGVAVGSSYTNEESVARPKERITFLPPASVIHRNEYAIENAAYYLMDMKTDGVSVPKESKPEKMTTTYTQNFSEASSPIHLTNFLTLSLKENFEEEWFIKNSFYLNQISEMELKHFRGKCTGTDENGNPICPKVLKSNHKYYLLVPKGYDFARRKQMKMTKYINPY